MKIISLSLYGDNPLYTQGAIENAEYAKKIYPDWKVRIYCHTSVPKNIIQKLRDLNADIIIINETFINDSNPKLDTNWGMYWRFFPLADKKVKYFIVRDADSRISWKEAEAVKEWIKSGKDYHILKDHILHGSPMMGGMWGAKGGIVPELHDLIRVHLKTRDHCKFASDQRFLAKYIYPKAINSCVNHRFFQTDKGFMHPKQEFIGQTINVKGSKAKIR